jgi:hypothetical protein
MKKPTLFMLLLGCKPKGRHTEQHDVFFSVSDRFSGLTDAIYSFWPDAGRIHVDSWRKLSWVDGYAIRVVERESFVRPKNQPNLYFLNLGGYQPGNPEELHYKLIVVASNKTEAIRKAKETAFFKHTGFHGAASHIDDQYGVDVDDLYLIQDILPDSIKEKYALELIPEEGEADELHIGYTKLPPPLK